MRNEKHILPISDILVWFWLGIAISLCVSTQVSASQSVPEETLLPDSTANDTVKVASGNNDNGEILPPEYFSSMVHTKYASRYKRFANDVDSVAIWRSLRGGRLPEKMNFEKQLKPNITVLGWHPYWAEEDIDRYDYNLLTMISWFGLDVQPADGNFKDVAGWQATQLPEIARANNPNISVLLTAVMQDSLALAEFLTDDNSIVNFADQLLAQLKSRGADGATIDFQNIPSRFGDQYLMLLQRVRELFDEHDLLLTVVTPAVIHDPGYDLAVVADIADALILTAYDYYGNGAKEGPFSVLYDTELWGQHSIESATAYFVDELGVSPEQLIISLSWIGSVHETDGANWWHFGYRSYAFMRNLFSTDDDQAGFLIETKSDKASRSSYYSYPMDSGNQRVFYFDTPDDWAFKLRWIDRQGLGGVGIWTLADSGEFPEYWQKLAETYGRPPPTYLSEYVYPFITLIRDNWNLPHIALYVSGGLLFLYFAVCIWFYITKSVPQKLQDYGRVVPIVVTILLLLAIKHDIFLLIYNKKDVLMYIQDPAGQFTFIGLLLAVIILGISTGLCIQLFYYDKKNLP